MTTPNDLRRSIELSDGLTLAELVALHPRLSRRTIQRWLAQLIADEVIRGEGLGKHRRFVSNSSSGTSQLQEENAAASEDAENSIDLSPGGREVLGYVSQSRYQRDPVGYQPEFLDDYMPNRTFYLAENLRRQLHNIGRTDDLQRPAGTYGRSVMHRLLIDLSWASSHLEGNTYSLLDTKKLIEFGQAIEGRDADETRMILNHKAAIEMLIENIDDVDFNRYTLLNLHNLLSEDLLDDDRQEGALRQHPVAIGGSVYQPLSVPRRVEEQFDLFLEKASQINDPFEQSFFAMVHIPYLQPFADVNKRTSRLAANIPLLKANLCPLTFLDVPLKVYNSAVLGVYELTRVDLMSDLYMWAYPRSARRYEITKREVKPDPFRLLYREVVREIVREVILHPERDSLELIASAVEKQVPEDDRQAVAAIVNDRIRTFHEGSLVRYGIRPLEYQHWKRFLSGEER